jgi:hypothetical protein
MTTLRSPGVATGKNVNEVRDARKAADKVRRLQYKQTRVDHDREVMLVGEAVLRRGERDEAEFRRMMTEALSRPADRALFDLE